MIDRYGWPHSDIPPGRVEADGDELLVSLDAVDGQLTCCGGSADGSGIVGEIKHEGGQTQAKGSGPSLSLEQKDPRGANGVFHLIIS